MAFSTGSHSTVAAAPNVTPLIDVLLVLLIIFMVIVPAASRGVTAEAAAATAAPDSSRSPRALVIEILPGKTPGAAVGVYHLGGQRLSLSGLRQALLAAATQGEHPAIWVKGDARLDYRAVVQVIAEAHRAGYQGVGLLPLAQVPDHGPWTPTTGAGRP